MTQQVDLRERLKMRFITVDYCGKQETYGGQCFPTGTIATDILNIPDSVLEELLELTEPMMQFVDFLNKNKNPDSRTLARMLTASKNVFGVVKLLRNVPPFAGQDFTWLDGKLPSIFSADAVKKAYRQRKKEMGEVFIPALCLVAQLGFGIRARQTEVIVDWDENDTEIIEDILPSRMGDLCYVLCNHWKLKAARECFEKLSWRDRMILQARNAICHNCGGMRPMKEQYSFREISNLIGSSQTKEQRKPITLRWSASLRSWQKTM